MPIDFDKLGETNPVDTAIEPATIFAALSRSPQYQYLRNVQGEVLDGWFKRRNERDLVLKMNTGAGKTVVGLLLLKSCLNEGAGPAAYITPDVYLAEQVAAEAAALGLNVVKEPSDPRFLAGQAILVDNIASIVNGRTVFGINRSTPLGSVLIDDAHSCLRISEEKFTLNVPASHEAYEEIFALLKPSLEQQSRVSVLDIVAGDPTKLMQAPYWTWRDKHADIVAILHKHRRSKELEWEWPLAKDALVNSTCVVSARSLSVTSRCLNIGVIRDFENAKRRIFTTATLADDSALVTHFRADAKSVSVPVTPKNASDIGERMILAPQELTPSITDEDFKAFIKWLGGYINVVIIVPSGKRAKFWDDIAAQTLTAGNIRKGVDALKAGLVGVTVLVNKYDGVDLPFDACRVLVIDGLPEVERPLDRIDASVLENSETMLARHVQRIEQGMGRGIRSNEDHCVVLLLGSKLVQRVGLPLAQNKFTPATRAQLELSRKVAAQLSGKPLKEMYTDAILACLDRNQAWIKQSRATVAGLVYQQSDVAAWATSVRAAFDLAILDRYPDAVAAMRHACNAEKDERVQGWLKQQLADYVHALNPTEAQQVQLSAQKSNRLVLKPIVGVEYIKLTQPTRSQAESLSALLKVEYAGPNQMLVGYNAILEELLFQDDSFRRFEAAIQELGFHLGFAAHRPEIEFSNGGPDDLWAVGGQRFIMIECKNEATAATISKEYVDKSSGRRNWFKSTYGPGCTADSIMVHPSRIVSHHAAPEPELRIMTKAMLDQLKEAIRLLARSIANVGFGDIAGIGKALNHLGLTGEKFTARYTEPFVMEPKPVNA